MDRLTRAHGVEPESGFYGLLILKFMQPRASRLHDDNIRC